VVHHRAGWLNPVFEGLSYAGRLGLLWIVIALVLCAVYRRWGVFALTVIAVALADWSATGLKALIGRPRPPVRYPEPKTLVPLPHDASFPSGHAATSFAAATMLSLSFPASRRFCMCSQPRLHFRACTSASITHWTYSAAPCLALSLRWCSDCLCSDG